MLPEKKDPAKGTHMGTKGGIRLMEVIFKELVDLNKSLEVELGTFVPSVVFVGHHHQGKTFECKAFLVFN
ncbi:MAG: hypothetical protein KAW52_06165 [candidate division Zixibacteria bacterium]|nr:hypothetical protein [candidate division Zixibacteria bacterium]